MTSLPQSAANPTPRSDLATSARAFGWHLRAANLSPLTVKTYLDSVEQLDRWFGDRGRAPSVEAIERRDLEEFIADQQGGYTRSYAKLPADRASCQRFGSGEPSY